MSIQDAGDVVSQIKAAIGVHGLWKNRIRQAINEGKSEWDPKFVAPCGNCDFGKWLDGIDKANQGDDYKTVYDLHSQFHKEAARVLEMALAGKKSEAEEAIASGSAYGTLTLNLTKAMMSWQKSVA